LRDDLIMVAEAFRCGGSYNADRKDCVSALPSPVWSPIEAGRVGCVNAGAKRLQDAGHRRNTNCRMRSTTCTTPTPISCRPKAERLFLPEYLSSYAILAPDLRGKVENARGVTRKSCWPATFGGSVPPAFDRLFGRGWM